AAFSIDDAADNWTGVQRGNGSIVTSYSPSWPDTRRTVYLRLSISSSGLATVSDNDGSGWSSVGSPKQLSELDILKLRSARIYMNGLERGGMDIGSINMLPSSGNTGNFFQFFLP